MKVSIITAVRNNADTIEQCIQSVYAQSFNNIEYIIIDGNSTDGTLAVINQNRQRLSELVSEPDQGIYYALNKGINLATGEIIGFLHADDIYGNNHVIEDVVSCMRDHNANSCYGDLQYVYKKNPKKILRFWRSGHYEDGLFRKGWMPPHQTFFVKREIYKQYGNFNTSFKIAADYELMLRFLEKDKISTCYIPEVLIKMRTGGTSNRNLKNLIIKTSEDYRAWKENGLHNSMSAVFLKNVSKIPQFFKR